MRCQSCSHENREGRRFCAECGAALAAACASCGAPHDPGERFCGQCGYALAEEPIARTPTPQPSPATPSSFAAGRYQVERFLGEGGKKRVYLARDTRLDTDVAVALIKTDGLDAQGLTRIRREAQAMGRLREEPHIVSVLDIGDEDGQPYIVQEYMAGGSLEELLAKSEGHRLDMDEASRISVQVCQALARAHAGGHRPPRPEAGKHLA